MNLIVLLFVVAIISSIVLLIDYFGARSRRLAEGEVKAPALIQIMSAAFVLSIIVLLLLTVNFELLLTSAVLIAGLFTLLDILWLKRRREAKGIPAPSVWVDYCRSFFPVLLIVLVIRSFIIQPYRVPTGSLEPTVMPGDLLAVNQFSYGLRLPVLHNKIVPLKEPKVGDIVVFRWPVNPKVDFVKRVIGTPGDTVEYKNKVLYINGKEAKQTLIGLSYDVEPASLGGNIPAEKREEDLNGVKHEILVRPQGGEDADFTITVPKGMYFMMGDNRDDSGDSRMWGFVPEKNLIGKAFIIWLSWDPKRHWIRWQRIGNRL